MKPGSKTVPVWSAFVKVIDGGNNSGRTDCIAFALTRLEEHVLEFAFQALHAGMPSRKTNVEWFRTFAPAFENRPKGVTSKNTVQGKMGENR